MKRLFLFLLFTSIACAHVGSPDIYADVDAGPYKLYVTIRPPMVIPGVAELEVRAQSAGIANIRALPLPMSGPGAKFAPLPDSLVRSRQDSQFFTGSLWMMAPGSWQVKIDASGKSGEGSVAVPVPSAALVTKPMTRGLGWILGGMLVLLVAGMVAIIGAGTRESFLPPGREPTPQLTRRGRIAMSIAFTTLIAIVWYGDRWWNAEASNYGASVYKPLHMAPSLNGSMLELKLSDPGWLSESKIFASLPVARSVDDLVMDHNHLMHLYAIREPKLDVVFHLHPQVSGPGEFQLALPDMPQGHYRLYADIVHASGFPETLVADVDTTGIHGRALAGDDAEGTAGAWHPASEFELPDGYRMQWVNAGPVKTRQLLPFHFRLLDAHGNAPKDMQLYMGMVGHAAFVKTDGTVFAHIHPTGSMAMAAFMQAQADPMAGMHHGPADSEVSFPYGVPTPGHYRVFVQMKHGGRIETGAFDFEAE